MILQTEKNVQKTLSEFLCREFWCVSKKQLITLHSSLLSFASSLLISSHNLIIRKDKQEWASELQQQPSKLSIFLNSLSFREKWIKERENISYSVAQSLFPCNNSCRHFFYPWWKTLEKIMERKVQRRRKSCLNWWFCSDLEWRKREKETEGKRKERERKERKEREGNWDERTIKKVENVKKIVFYKSLEVWNAINHRLLSS